MASELPKEWWDDTTPPPARDWKPVVGEKVLVEATVIRLRPERDGYLDVEIADHYYYADTGDVSDLEAPYGIRLPISSIHPMPGREEKPKPSDGLEYDKLCEYLPN